MPFPFAELSDKSRENLPISPEHRDVKLQDTLYTGPTSDLFQVIRRNLLLKLSFLTFLLKIFLMSHGWNGYLLERKINVKPRKST